MQTKEREKKKKKKEKKKERNLIFQFQTTKLDS